MEFTQRLVVTRDRPFALKDMDLDRRLIVGCRRKDLRFACRDRRVLLNHRRHHAAQSLDSERQRRHVEQENVGLLATQNARLDRSTESDHFVRIDRFVRLFAKEVFDHLLNLRDTCRTADEYDLFDVFRFEPGVLDRLFDRRHQFLENRLGKLFEFRTSELHHQMLWSRGVRRDERQVDLGLHRRRKLDLGLFCRFFQTLQRHFVVVQIDALIFLKFVDDPADQDLVDIVTAKVRVAVGRFDLDHAFADFEHRNIKRAAAKIKHSDDLVFLLVQPVRQCGRCRLIDDTQNFEARDLAGVLGRLTLRIIKIRRHGDYRLFNFRSEIILGRLLQFLQHHRRDLGRAVMFAVNIDADVAVAGFVDLVRHLLDLAGDLAILAAHKTLDRVERVFRIGDSLAFGHLPDKPVAVLCECNDRRRRTSTLTVCYDDRLAAFHNGDYRICRSQIDSNYLAHNLSPKNYKCLPSPFYFCLFTFDLQRLEHVEMIILESLIVKIEFHRCDEIELSHLSN